MPRITLYVQPGFQLPGRPPCLSGTPFAIKVARVLRFKGLAFEVDAVEWAERAQRLPEISASGKLPVLEYDGERVEDSTEIAHFLEARHPTPPLWPSDPLLRSRCHFLEEWADEVLYWYGVYEQRHISDPELLAAAYFPELPEDAKRRVLEGLHATTDRNLWRQGIGRYPVDKVKGDVLRGLDALAALLEADAFVAGPEPSLADLALFGQLHRRLAGTNPWLESEVERRPGLVAWLGRIDALTSG